MVVGTVWLAPPQRAATQMTVMLPTATYQKLALLGKVHVDENGRHRTVAQVIEEFANNWEGENEAPVK